MKKVIVKKTAQDIQDEIFRKMPVNKKFLLFAKFWKLAKTLAPQNPLWKKATRDISSSPLQKF
jgi:hypothetical protein